MGKSRGKNSGSTDSFTSWAIEGTGQETRPAQVKGGKEREKKGSESACPGESFFTELVSNQGRSRD